MLRIPHIQFPTIGHIVKMVKFHHNPYYRLFGITHAPRDGHHRASTFSGSDTQNLRKKAIKAKKKKKIHTKISRTSEGGKTSLRNTDEIKISTRCVRVC